MPKFITVQEHQMEVLTQISEQVEARIRATKDCLMGELADNNDIGIYHWAMDFAQCTKDRGEIARIKRSVEKLKDRYGVL